jgi:hypothetical protein
VLDKRNINSNKIDIKYHCSEQDIDCCATESKFPHIQYMCVFLYRAMKVDFEIFLHK